MATDSPIHKNLGVCDDYYSSRLSEQLPMNTRIGMPDASTSINGIDIHADSMKPHPPLEPVGPCDEEEVDAIEERKNRRSPKP